jgi:hypothetical protein
MQNTLAGVIFARPRLLACDDLNCFRILKRIVAGWRRVAAAAVITWRSAAAR